MTIIIIIITNLSKVSDRQCKTVYDTSYEGHVETQCKPGYASKCKTVYKTGYKKYSLAQIYSFLLVSSGSALQCTMKSVESATRQATRQSMTRNVQPPMSSLATM